MVKFQTHQLGDIDKISDEVHEIDADKYIDICIMNSLNIPIEGIKAQIPPSDSFTMLGICISQLEVFCRARNWLDNERKPEEAYDTLMTKFDAENPSKDKEGVFSNARRNLYRFELLTKIIMGNSKMIRATFKA